MDTERGHYETLEGNFEDGEHIWQSHGTKIAVKGLEEGVKWLGFQWSPMLGRGTVKQTLTKLVQEAIGQLKEVEVSAESTLYLCDAVVWGKMNYKAYLGALSKTEMEELEKGIRHCS